MQDLFKPAYKGQNLYDFTQGNDALATATDPILDGQGRMRRASAATGDPILTDYDRASIDRHNRAGSGDFNAIMRPGQSNNSELTTNNSTGSPRAMTYAQARKLGAGSHAAARKMIARHEMGINPASGRSYTLENNDRLRGDLLEQEVATRPQFNDLAIQERTQRIEQNNFNMETAIAQQEAAKQAAWEQQILNESIGAQRNDVLLDQNPGYGTVTTLDPALDAAMDHNAAGRLEVAADFLDMRPEPAPESPRLVDLGDGVKVIQQGERYLGTAPRPQGEQAPTATTRNNHAFMQALEEGNFAMAALYMDPIEEADKRGLVSTKRQATAEDARRYYHQMQGNPQGSAGASSSAPAAVSTADAMELFKSTK